MLKKATLILKFAENLFEQYGYKKVSIDEIVKNAGIAKGTFYLYFKNKNELYEAILRKYESEAKACMQYLAKQEKDIKKRLYRNYMGSLLFCSKKKILKEIILENTNYYSETVDKKSFMASVFSLIKVLLDKDVNQLRSDITLDEIGDIHTFYLMILRYSDCNEEYFWNLSDKLAKCIIDGMLAKEKWGITKEIIFENFKNSLS